MKNEWKQDHTVRTFYDPETHFIVQEITDVFGNTYRFRTVKANDERSAKAIINYRKLLARVEA